MGFDKVRIGTPEIQLILELSTVFGESQGLSRKTAIVLSQGEIVAFYIGSVNLALATIGLF